MIKFYSLAVVWLCSLTLVCAPLAALYLLIDLELFVRLARGSLALPIQWGSVERGQWYGLWGLSMAYLSLGLVGLYFLRRAFSKFADGEFFTLANSHDLRIFSILLFAQALAKPLHFACSSLLLSMNHSPGQKVLSFAFGSGEIKVLALAMILWVISALLVKANELDHENKQFV